MKILLAGVVFVAVVVGLFASSGNIRFDATIVGPGPQGLLEVAQELGPGPLGVVQVAQQVGPGPLMLSNVVVGSDAVTKA